MDPALEVWVEAEIWKEVLTVETELANSPASKILVRMVERDSSRCPRNVSNRFPDERITLKERQVSAETFSLHRSLYKQ
jgi:hypothetical protein